MSEDNVQTVIPKQEKIRRMAERFCSEIEDPEERAKNYHHVWGYCDATFEEVLKEHPDRNAIDAQQLLIELAFWRGLYAFVHKRAKFVIADKVGFMPASDTQIADARE